MNHQNQSKRELSEYEKKLLDPRWQKKRLEILQRDEWTCQLCKDTTTTLHVHHHYYDHGLEPWEYPGTALMTLCSSCHEIEGTMRPHIELLLVQALRRFGTTGKDLAGLIKGLKKHTDIADRCPEYQRFPHDAFLPAIAFTLQSEEAYVAMITRYMEHRTNRSIEQDTDE